MTKAELVNTISNKLGTEKNETQKVIEAFMQEIRTSMYNGDNVYLRGFGSFIIKTRAAKTGRNISKNIAIEIPAHNIPAFKPSKTFVEKIKTKVPVAQLTK
ncbi:HU family DNA-binding protein [Kaistella sp.]|uniref:HU family DNA-binding protein n=1 Tax=Kaistella sp. TaxID=2782235 RepID=UPI00359F6FF2